MPALFSRRVGWRRPHCSWPICQPALTIFRLRIGRPCRRCAWARSSERHCRGGGVLGGVDFKDSLVGANQISRLLLGGSLGCNGPLGIERCSVAADGAVAAGAGRRDRANSQSVSGRSGPACGVVVRRERGPHHRGERLGLLGEAVPCLQCPVVFRSLFQRALHDEETIVERKWVISVKSDHLGASFTTACNL